MDVAVAESGPWVIRFAGNRYDLQLINGDLRNTYFGADTDADIPPMAENRQNRDNLSALRSEAAVFVGPRADRVLWGNVAAQQVDNVLTLRLTGVNHPVAMHLTITPDAATGSILRQSTLEHTGGSPVDIRGALSLSALVAGPVTGATYVTGA